MPPPHRVNKQEFQGNQGAHHFGVVPLNTLTGSTPVGAVREPPLPPPARNSSPVRLALTGAGTLLLSAVCIQPGTGEPCKPTAEAVGHHKQQHPSPVRAAHPLQNIMGLFLTLCIALPGLKKCVLPPLPIASAMG